ncbi:MAG: DNA ligase (NAD(+)) LigA [Myxococcales bacterium]|nr:DNA ligase (NAD(+)) LigA [Myxococcales bacterium]
MSTSTTEPFVELWTEAQLAAKIAELDVAYHNLGQSLASDAYYDRLKELLAKRNASHPLLSVVGSSSSDNGDKVEHQQPMLSLDKCTEFSDFSAWYRGVFAQATDRANSAKLDDEVKQWAQTPRGALVALPKIDGLACSLRYDDGGTLVRAATRGDGRFGEDVTVNAGQIPTIAKALLGESQIGRQLEVRGEVYLPLSRFAQVAGEYANPRNLAAGTLKSKDSSAIPLDWLAFYAYDLLGSGLPTETAKLTKLREMGFAVPNWRPVAAAQATQVFNLFAADRATDDFEADGIVVRMDDCTLAQRLGSTSHHPRSAIAWKFAVAADTSILQAIHWSVARTGAITPVALVAPVNLSGATVTRATLHNVSNLRRLALRSGDKIEIVRRGGVIPHVERVIEAADGQPIGIPENCPGCSKIAVVVSRDDGKGRVIEVLQCSDPANCLAARQRSLLHFCQTLDLEGFGDKVVEILLDQGLVDTAADLFALTRDDLLPLPRFGELLVKNLIGQIDRARRVELPAFLVALGIPALGKQTAQLLATRGNLAQVRSLTKSDISSLHSLGYKTAEAIVTGLADNAELIDALLQHIEVIAPQQVAPQHGYLTGQIVVFTGTLEAMGRREAQKLVVQLGGVAGDSLTSETTLLVVGGDELVAALPSAKLKKARKLLADGNPIHIESAANFFARIASEPA